MSRRRFFAEQIAALEPLEFVAFIAAQPGGVAYVEIHRGETAEHDPQPGAAFRVEAGGEPALPMATVEALTRLGLTAQQDAAGCDVPTIESAAELTDRILAEAFRCSEGAALDVQHASRRAEVEAERRLEAVRERLAQVLARLLDPVPVELDDDGDFTFPYVGCRLYVAPRTIEGGPPAVRIMTMTNIDVEPSVALGLFVAQTDFELEIGRLSYDGQDGVVWFEVDLLGSGFSDDDLTFALQFVAEAAAEFAGRVRSLFGGSVVRGEGAAPSDSSKGKRVPSAYL